MAALKPGSMQELLDLHECPICVEPMYPPIFQCQNGHLLCSKCKDKVTKCHSCQAEKLDIRSLAIEKLMAYLEYPCRYHSYGCEVIVLYTVKQIHEDHCRFKPFSCPESELCEVKGDIPTLLNHLKLAHKCRFYDGPEFANSFTDFFPQDNRVNAWAIRVYNCLGKEFCLYMDAFPSPNDLVYSVFMAFMGESLEAQEFRCKLEVSSDTQKLSWEGTPQSIREGRKKLRSEGLIIHPTMASRYNKSRTAKHMQLHVKGSVWKHSDSKRGLDDNKAEVNGVLQTGNGKRAKVFGSSDAADDAAGDDDGDDDDDDDDDDDGDDDDDDDDDDDEDDNNNNSW